MRGFALLLSVMFLLLLTLFSFCMLQLSSSYYSSSRELIYKENARLACEGAVLNLILRHNTAGDNPRFFFSPVVWNGTSLKPFWWSRYMVSASLTRAWSATAANDFTVSARRNAFVARESIQIEQLRGEDFALFEESSQQLSVAPLFDGRVRTGSELALQSPTQSVFRNYVHSSVRSAVTPVFRRHSLEELQFPPLQTVLSLNSVKTAVGTNAIFVSNRNPQFWTGDHYELNLDDLTIQQQKNGWRITYKGSPAGSSQNLVLWFDDTLEIRQSNWPAVAIDPSKPSAPLYFFSDRDIVIHSNITILQSAAAIHPAALAANGTIRLDADVPLACRIEALLLALGQDVAGVSLQIREGGHLVSPAEKQFLLNEISHSTFLVEDNKRAELEAALAADKKIVWFKSGAILAGTLQASNDLAELHFQSSRQVFPLFPAFPFVYQVDGSRQWQ